MTKAPSVNSKASTSWLMSTIWAPGAMPRMTPFMTPTKWAAWPKSVVNVMVGAGIAVKIEKKVLRSYFDHNATTPVSREVLDSLVPALSEVYGNPSSILHHGQIAKQRVEMARRQVASFLHCDPREIVFVSGGTESDNLAIFGTARGAGHAITTAIEHPAVLNAFAQLEREGVDVTYVRSGSNGIVD